MIPSCSLLFIRACVLSAALKKAMTSALREVIASWISLRAVVYCCRAATGPDSTPHLPAVWAAVSDATLEVASPANSSRELSRADRAAVNSSLLTPISPLMPSLFPPLARQKTDKNYLLVHIENTRSFSKVHEPFNIWDYFRVKENVRQRWLSCGSSSVWDCDPHPVGCDQ